MTSHCNKNCPSFAYQTPHLNYLTVNDGASAWQNKNVSPIGYKILKTVTLRQKNRDR